MWATIVVTVAAFGLLMGLMALGLVLSGQELKGSCGGNPDSAHCGCSPAKKAACRSQAHLHETEEDEHDIYSGPRVTSESLAPPGEQRLIQLRTGRR